ncbi:M13-type metalloendopeptidase [Amnibacterium sp. CER49]|uniref:M13 family metallopeptidase n=1 Tax=Amnibacterium sp. CER49 TaxID=3039161 RepID=UPI00244BF05F|nr:M13-type metalloendopeptidase [Amnibacterium sp. CER49]MDH2443590.1 M13-type metalloendopeptidase [Amnibacterium sp. CER49]
MPAGIDTATFDPRVRVQDDLFRHVNGQWLRNAEIPADRARSGAFLDLVDGAEAAVRTLIEEAQGAEPGTEARKIGDLYTSFMAEDAVEAAGAAPLAEPLGLVAAADSVAAVLATLGALERTGAGSLFQLFVDNDPGDPSRYLVFVEQGGLGLPDERYYREDGFGPQRDAYRTFLAAIYGLAGLAEPEQRAERVLALETEIAAQHWDAVRTRDVQATYNPTSWAELVAQAGEHGALLESWAAGLAAPAGALDTLVIREPSFLSGVLGLLTADRLDAWRDWLAARVIRPLSPYLSTAFVDAHFAFTGGALTGAQEVKARWKRGVAVTEGALGEAVGRLYVERHFPPVAKLRMDVLVANLVAAYRSSISSLDWLGEETRAKALTKLARFTPKIGYPVTWRDYTTLEIRPDDLVGNVRRAAAFEFDRELGKIGRPVDRDEWFMTPQTVNAYYNPGMNEIVFPAAILQPPFFDPDRDEAANYGGIGAVIGHEIGHGFDDQGSQFDGDGRLDNWWTEQDRTAFEERTKALIAQYDELVPEGLTDHVNGALTIGENIGDLGGLTIAWKAYVLSLEGREPPVIDGLTAAQRFFFSWASVWREKRRQAESIRLLTIDPHSPPEFRCNQIVRNLDQFVTAFDLTETDALWLPPAKRVTIW